MLVEFVAVFVTAFALYLVVPFAGAAVRVRANFKPKSIHLVIEDNVQSHIGPAETSFFGMLRRVKRIEGWAGLYKGFMPTFLLTVFLAVPLYALQLAHEGGRASEIGILLGFLSYALVALLLAIPATVIQYRSITTPYKLPYFRPLYSLRVLLTPTERRRPWTMYFAPGLFAAMIVYIACTILLGVLLKLSLYGSIKTWNSPMGEIGAIKLGILIATWLVSTIVFCPLEVIICKLAIQRNYVTPEYISVAREVGDDVEVVEEYVEYGDEDVISLRYEMEPYRSLLDCVRKVAAEEGWQSLYRLWWLKAINILGTILST